MSLKMQVVCVWANKIVNIIFKLIGKHQVSIISFPHIFFSTNTIIEHNFDSFLLVCISY